MEKNIVKFIHISAWYPKLEGINTNSGWCFTKYNEETKEGEGYFSSERRAQFDFIRRRFGGQLMESTRGYGEGCVWSEWREVVESVEE